MFRVHFANDPSYVCGCALEYALHFILECGLWNETSEEFKLAFLHEITNESFFGDDTLTDIQNLQTVHQTHERFYP